MPALPCTRFAPSPNGELHLGHALSAIIGFEWARRLGGRFLLRIEDLDPVRSREDYISAILRDLAWLGLSWEEPVMRQSRELPIYAAAARRLEHAGLLYRCTASRSEIAAACQFGRTDPDGAPLYPGRGRCIPSELEATRLAEGAPFALRLDMARAVTAAGEVAFAYTALDDNGHSHRVDCDPRAWGDAVIVRKDAPASYHLAVVVDDARQDVTHVTRGRDLEAATPLHRLLQRLLGLPPPLYHHHRLIVDEGGRKLAKSARDTSLRELRDAGATPQDVRRMIGAPAPA